MNWGLQRYVKRYPDSRFAKELEGDTWRLHHYIVPVTSMAIGLALWIGSMCGGIDTWNEWWFGAQRQWSATLALGLGAGHYAQELLMNEWSGTILMMHHIAAVLFAWCLEATSSWRGLLMSWGGVYEAGSLLLCLGYLGAVSRPLGHWAACVTSVVGMCFGLHGLVVHRPLSELNAATWFSIIALLLLGVGRIQDGIVNIQRLNKHCD